MTLRNVSKNVPIFADSAEPKSIQDLKNMGWRNVQGAEKGKDSIMFGIQAIQELDIKVTSSSLNLIKELRSYIWQKDKTGMSTNKPIDAFNHCIDGIRYFYTTKNKFKGQYFIARV
jgi:phage terminase large subunit